MHLPKGSDQFVFLHIPKTAGTAFTNYLRRQWPSGKVAQIFVGDYDAIGTSNPNLTLFCGHMTHSEMRKRLPSAHYITFLRDPLARAFSQFKSWSDPKNFPADDPWRAVMTAEQIAEIELAQTLSFDEFILAERPTFDAQLNNVQTLTLSNAAPGTPEFLPSAKETLNSTLFFGIVEMFNDSIAMLRKAIPHLDAYDLPAELENRGRNLRMEISSAARSRLKDLIAVDRQLYEYAVELLRQRQRSHSFSAYPPSRQRWPGNSTQAEEIVATLRQVV